MNHSVEHAFLRGVPGASFPRRVGDDPVRCVAATVAEQLARAHEEGLTDQVRLLHAVLALLAATSRD